MTKTLHPTKDTLQDSYTIPAWTKASEVRFPYNHSRPLPEDTAQKAIDYIAAITKQYPFQIRFEFAKDHWDRFAQEWCDTGDESKALRVI